MICEINQKICDDIYKYINEELSEWLNNEILTKTTMEQLGKLYYDHVLNMVNNSKTEFLNAVIKAISPKEFQFNCIEDFYCRLCKALRIKVLPSTVMADVEKQYNEVFVQKYNLVMQKYQSALDDIKNKLIQVKSDSDVIKNTPPSHSFIRDISTDEKKLFELCSECNALRTRKEMLDFAIGYMNSKLTEFCNIQDATSVEDAKMRTILKLSREDSYDANFEFSSYRSYVDLVEDDIDRPYVLFFKVKIYTIVDNANKNYRNSTLIKSNEEAIDEYKNYLNLIPKIDDLNSYKSDNSSLYNSTLEKLIQDYGLLEELKAKIESSVCLRERKNILLKAVELFEQKEFEVFNNILPVQIEGMFADYLRDATTFLRFSKMDIYVNAVLKEKIKHLQEVKSDIYPEAVEYFMYYFNNMIRNKIAHGRYNSNSKECIEDEIFSKELILDMILLVHMLSRKSETEKMYRFIHGYQAYYKRFIKSAEHPCFGALFNDMIGDKLVSDYDTIEKYRPIQVAYWLVNPYYERIYEQVDDKSDLLELRDEFLSKEFWEYVLEKLNEIISHGYDYRNINMEFISVVKGLFKYNVSQEVKQVLGRVHEALLKIQSICE